LWFAASINSTPGTAAAPWELPPNPANSSYRVNVIGSPYDHRAAADAARRCVRPRPEPQFAGVGGVLGDLAQDVGAALLDGLQDTQGVDVDRSAPRGFQHHAFEVIGAHRWWGVAVGVDDPVSKLPTPGVPDRAAGGQGVGVDRDGRGWLSVREEFDGDLQDACGDRIGQVGGARITAIRRCTGSIGSCIRQPRS
jgi:hypothetical protein